MNEMIRKGGVDVCSSIANSEGTVNIPEEYLGGMSFIKFKLDKDRNVLVNDVTNEETPELFVRICGVRMERVLIEDGALVCSSRDSKYSKDGILCETCPNVNNSPFIDGEEQRARYMESCRKQHIENPPEWNFKTKCSFRLIVEWVEQFEKSEDGSYMWIVQPGLCYLSCPKSSVAAMTFKQTGYLSRLKSKGYGDLKNVVTKISVGQRRNEKLKANYSYEVFDLEGSYLDITKKCVNYHEMVNAMGGEQCIADKQPQVAQVAHMQKNEEIQPELPQIASPKTMPKDSSIKEAEVVDQPQATKVAPMASTTEMRLKVKIAYASLPADIQKLVLGELHVDNIDSVGDGELHVATGILDVIKKEIPGKVEEKVAVVETVVVNKDTNTSKPVTKKTPW